MFSFIGDALLSGTFQKWTFFALIGIAILLILILGVLSGILGELQKGNQTKDNDR